MEPTFSNGNVVRHVKTDGVYVITDTPRPQVLLEYCREPFYDYWEIDTNNFWLRRQSEMEDGRFILIAETLEDYRSMH